MQYILEPDMWAGVECCNVLSEADNKSVTQLYVHEAAMHKQNRTMHL